MNARRLCVALMAPWLTVASLRAQSASTLASRPDVHALLDSIKARNAWTLSQQVALCEIPAPPFKEGVRAQAYLKAFQDAGLSNVRIDSVGNVIGERRGTGGGSTVLIEGHLDTVFPEGTDVRVRREGERYIGRGISDDCRGLATVLSVARALQHSPIATTGTIIFAGNVGEEGAGNLRGTRHLFGRELAGRVDYFISVDSPGDTIVNRAVGSNRYRFTYKGRGGHSYHDFGIPNPAHAMGRAIASIADLRTPASPRTTFSVSVVKGGTSVNAIPYETSMEVDMRSESAASLARLDVQVQRAVRRALAAENARWPASTAKLSLVVDTIGLRPAGSEPDSLRIVRLAREASRAVGMDGPLSSASTDANVPMALGIPAVTIGGGGLGGGFHGLDEWFEDGPAGWRGAQRAALLVLALAGLTR